MGVTKNPTMSKRMAGLKQTFEKLSQARTRTKMARDPNKKLKRRMSRRVASARKIYEQDSVKQEGEQELKEQEKGVNAQKLEIQKPNKQQQKQEHDEKEDEDRILPVVDSREAVDSSSTPNDSPTSEAVDSSTPNDSPTSKHSPHCDDSKGRVKKVKEEEQSSEAEVRNQRVEEGEEVKEQEATVNAEIEKNGETVASTAVITTADYSQYAAILNNDAAPDSMEEMRKEEYNDDEEKQTNKEAEAEKEGGYSPSATAITTTATLMNHPENDEVRKENGEKSVDENSPVTTTTTVDANVDVTSRDEEIVNNIGGYASKEADDCNNGLKKSRDIDDSGTPKMIDDIKPKTRELKGSYSPEKVVKRTRLGRGHVRFVQLHNEKLFYAHSPEEIDTTDKLNQLERRYDREHGSGSSISTSHLNRNRSSSRILGTGRQKIKKRLSDRNVVVIPLDTVAKMVIKDQQKMTLQVREASQKRDFTFETEEDSSLVSRVEVTIWRAHRNPAATSAISAAAKKHNAATSSRRLQ